MKTTTKPLLCGDYVCSWLFFYFFVTIVIVIQSVCQNYRIWWQFIPFISQKFIYFIHWIYACIIILFVIHCQVRFKCFLVHKISIIYKWRGKRRNEKWFCYITVRDGELRIQALRSILTIKIVLFLGKKRIKTWFFSYSLAENSFGFFLTERLICFFFT